MDFNIKASKGRCPAPKTLLSVPPSLARHCSVFPTAARAQVPPCYLAAGGDQAGQTPECHLPEFPLLSKLQGNWKISPRATLTFLKSWMEVWDIPLLNKQNKINWSDDVVLLHFLRDRGLPGEQRETMGMGKGPALTSSSEPLLGMGKVEGPSQLRRGGEDVPPWLHQDHLQCLVPGPREASVLSHRRGNELQLEILILENAVESRATLGATEWPVALTAAILGEFCEESQPGTSSVETTKLIKSLDLLWVQDRF